MQQTYNAPVLKVEDLEIIYKTRAGPLRAIRDVSFEVRSGDALGIVGESGCGKSTLAYGVMNYIAKNGQITKGQIQFGGDDIPLTPTCGSVAN
jgi:peptide/nickel transport system ATP-binding protein